MPSLILVADDSEMVRDCIADILLAAGHRVETAADGHAALESMASHPPDLVFLDVDMPGLSGWEVLQVMRSTQKWTRIPVVVVSGAVRQGSSVELADFDLTYQLAKPVGMNDILSMVSRVLSRDP